MKPAKAIAFPCAPRKGQPLGVKYRCWRVGVDDNKSALGAAVRQQFPIVAWTGSNGGGKTFGAVYDCLPTLAGIPWACRNIGHLHCHSDGCTFRPDTLAGCSCPELAPALAALVSWNPDAGDVDQVDGLLSDWDGPIPGTTSGLRRVWSTTPLLEVGPDGRRRPHPLYRPVRGLRDLVRAEHGRLLLDEVQGIADARDHASMPAGFRKRIYELRRADVRVAWTAIDYSAADSRMRQVTQAVVYARGFEEVTSTIGANSWVSKQRFRWTTYDAAEFDLFTAGKRESATALGVQHIWRPGHLVESSYDTLAPVLGLSMASESGSCTSCGGRKAPDACGCPPDETILPAGVTYDLTGRTPRRVPVDQVPTPRAPARKRAARARGAAPASGDDAQAVA